MRREKFGEKLERLLVPILQQSHWTNESTLLELSRLGILLDGPNP